MRNRIAELLDGRPVTWLARKTGIPRTTLTPYVKNEVQPPVDKAYLIADALNEDIKTVFPRVDVKQ